MYRRGFDALDIDSLAHHDELLAMPKKIRQQFVGIWEHCVRMLEDQAMKEHLLSLKAAWPTTLHASRNMTWGNASPSIPNRWASAQSPGIVGRRLSDSWGICDSGSWSKVKVSQNNTNNLKIRSCLPALACFCSTEPSVKDSKPWDAAALETDGKLSGEGWRVVWNKYPICLTVRGLNRRKDLS